MKRGSGERAGRALLVLALALIGGSACRRASPTDSRVTPSSSARGPSQVTALQIANPQHDFGEVIQGNGVSHTFELSNVGLSRFDVDGTSEALGCTGELVPRSLEPGAVGRLQVTCQPEFYGPLKVTLPVRSTTSETAARVELSASVTPLLVFDPPLVDLRMPFGQERTLDVHVRGALAAGAILNLESTGELHVVVTPLPATSDTPLGLRLRVKGGKVGVHVGNIVVSTHLLRPSSLSLPYSCEVTGSLAVTPSTPYFDLKAPGEQVRRITVHSSQSGFALRAVRVAEGPFSASFAPDAASGDFTVTVAVRAERIANGARGSIGRLLILSNDRSEPEKELPLFAFGAPSSSAPD